MWQQALLSRYLDHAPRKGSQLKVIRQGCFLPGYSMYFPPVYLQGQEIAKLLWELFATAVRLSSSGTR